MIHVVTSYTLLRDVVNEGEECYMKSVVIKGCTRSSFFFYFPANGSTNPDVF